MIPVLPTTDHWPLLINRVSKLSISDLQLTGKRVFMRVDFNVPVAKGAITDDTRIKAVLPSILHVQNQGGRLILASHMGRPKGKPDPALSLQSASTRLEELLGKRVGFSSDSVGAEAVALVDGLSDGDVLVLENLRFHAGEEADDPEFASELASLCDVYVNDAFGTAHRSHASTVGIAHHVSPCAAGFLLEKELESLSRALVGADQPYVLIVGGAKISGKVELIENFLKIADEILIGGAMAYTFFRAQGIVTGNSLVEESTVELAGRLLEAAGREGTRIHLPADHVVARNLDGAGMRSLSVADTEPEEMGLDIGPETAQKFTSIIEPARTIVWNGPMGVFENPKFAEGTLSIARAVASANAFSIVGGGDSAAAVIQSGIADRITHISTGGGATLEFLSGRKLPGVEVLTEGGS